ncbi:hypothetical protein DPEC_G00327960 [Dallia pectoralis]|uniref:Uncharacterized protein n=1 Tax=Dallia pectoralis TaxID=75939 RepID=A0ACC2F8A5_DALPE|nr:hypothetical protein DPEC_G00327960 [Dallia pectoralis]
MSVRKLINSVIAGEAWPIHHIIRRRRPANWWRRPFIFRRLYHSSDLSPFAPPNVRNTPTCQQPDRGRCRRVNRYQAEAKVSTPYRAHHLAPIHPWHLQEASASTWVSSNVTWHISDTRLSREPLPTSPPCAYVLSACVGADPAPVPQTASVSQCPPRQRGVIVTGGLPVS